MRNTYGELVQELLSQLHLNGDESPTKQGTLNSWLWTFVAKHFTVFALRGSRAATTLHELLGKTFSGVMSYDRAKMYWQCGKLQWCWAHLKRDIQALIEHSDHQVKRLGHDLLRQAKELFGQWARYRDGTISRTRLKQVLSPVRDKVNALLLLRGHGTNVDGMCQELYNHRQWLWTFLDRDGV
ncbi:IS66 family transposase [Planctomicrobium sp. SH527]|uniref:IS66 family transposase n=1 Tax=Planctomicrobium sp. SH527 TaxID=3448123 RepID=UPI003F5C74DA